MSSQLLKARTFEATMTGSVPEPVDDIELPPELIEQLAQALARALVASIRRDQENDSM